MSPERIVAIAVLSLFLIVLIIIFIKMGPRRLGSKRFATKWQELQNKCADPEKWPEALKDADKLLDDALKRRRFKGKTTGERMVSAQRLFTDNDSVWFGHKLKKKCDTDKDIKPTQSQMKKALMGLGRALKDLGALK